MTSPMVLDVVELHACWAVLPLGEPPSALDLQHPPGHTVDEQRAHYTRAFAALRRRGLADPDADLPAPGLAGALRLLARATREWDLCQSSGLVTIGAADGERGMVLEQRAGRYTLRPVPGSRIPAALVELLGPLRPGRARALSIPAEALDAARRTATDGALWTLADRLVGTGVDRADASSLARMCADVRAAAQFGGLVRRDGVVDRTPWVVGVHRADHGDYLQLRRPGGAGAIVTIAPVDEQRLLDEVRRLVPAGERRRRAGSAHRGHLSARIPAAAVCRDWSGGSRSV